MHQLSVDTAVACAVRTFAFPPASFRAHGPRYYRVYPKTVRRTVVLCRGGPRGRPPPGNYKGCPYGCTSAFGLRMVAGRSFSVASPYAQIYRRRGSRVRSAHHRAGAKKPCASAPYTLTPSFAVDAAVACAM